MGAIAIVLLIIILMRLLVAWRMRKATRKVRALSEEEKIKSLTNALSPFGFLYETGDDSISSGMYPWQRDMGYGRIYDEAAPSMGMIFECEPIYFDYEGKHYLIEAWKGQYGCTTGAELGVYVNREATAGKAPEELFYECVKDEERLPMQYTLYCDEEIVLRRSALHWWLTGFCVGMFSGGRELRMEISIIFPNPGMTNAFYQGLLRAGYRQEEIIRECNRVTFAFSQPKSSQPERYRPWLRKLKNRVNRRNCRRYCKVTKKFRSTLDKITYIGYCFPGLYKAIVGIGAAKTRRKFNKMKRR